MNTHTLLFLAANPLDTDRLALDREARAIQIELELSGHRDRFELVTRWAVEPLDLLRELRKRKPTVVHFSGHGGSLLPGRHRADGVGYRDVNESDQASHGLYFQGPGGGAQRVSAEALQETFGAAGTSVQLVVLNACYSAVQANALLGHVDCVVGMDSAAHDDAARSFAIGFYGGLGEGESVAAAYRQGCAAIRLQALPGADLPRLAVRQGLDAQQLMLSAPSRAATRNTRMAHDELLTRLSRLLPSQFDEVLFRASVPTAHLPGGDAPQTQRAIAAIRALEQEKRLGDLARILDEVARPS